MTCETAVVYAERVAAYPELVAGAEGLAETVVAVVVGTDADASAVAELGVDVRLLARNPELLLEDHWPSVAGVIAGLAPQVVLLRASVRVRTLAARLAVEAGFSTASDPAGLGVADSGISYRLVRYGGASEQESVASAVVAIVGPGLFAAAQPSGGGAVTRVDADVTTGPVTRVARSPRTEESVDLAASEVVVGVGRGIGSQANLATAADAAKTIGAELACSRPIAEGLGWLPKNRYLGVSGAVIQPDVYLALGISGQVQHLVGVNGSKSIVAINKDPNAPIFAHCDLGLVADLDAILPELAGQLG